MEMAKTRLEKNGVKYSVPVYGYVLPTMKEDLDMIRDVNPAHYSNSQIVQDALAFYVPQLKAKLGLENFRKPTHGAPVKQRKHLTRA